MQKLILYLLILNLSSIAIGQQIINNDKTKTSQINLVLVENDGLFGLITNEGKLIVKPRYDMIGEFGEYKKDWALVQKNCLFGFIDTNGKEVVKPRYDMIGEFGEYKDDWALIQKDCLFGFINLEGNEIVKPRFDYISDDFISEMK